MQYLLHLFFFVTVLSLQELCCRAIVAKTTVYGIEQLPLPLCIKSHLKSYAMTRSTTLPSTGKKRSTASAVSSPAATLPATRPPSAPRNSCIIA